MYIDIQPSSFKVDLALFFDASTRHRRIAMTPSHIQRVVVASLPKGPLDPSAVFRKEVVPWDFQVNDGEALVQTLYISVDAGLRAYLDESFLFAIAIGEIMRGSAVGVVKEVGQNCSKVAVGDFVSYRPGASLRYLSSAHVVVQSGSLYRLLIRLERLGSISGRFS